MALFENTECPVCKKLFEAGDDIVVCPDCGTPHHRECYRLVGRCVNSGLHEAGYNFRREHAPVIPAPPQDAPVFYTPSPEQRQEADGAAPEALLMPHPALQHEFAGSQDTLEGKYLSDIAVTVGPNASAFVRRFKKLTGKSRIGWNWSAFFFGSFYFFYRKMHRFGVSLLSLGVALICASNFLTMKVAPKAVAVLQELGVLASQRDMNAFNAKMAQFQQAPDLQKAVIVSYATLGILLLLHIVEALFADALYKKQVYRIIDTTKEDWLNDAAVVRNPYTDSVNLNEGNMHQLILAKRGGVNFFAPMIAFLIAYTILTVI